MEGNIAATYALIYRFLKQQSQNKAAEAVKKAAKAFVVLRDDIGQEGPPLQDIIKEWRTQENTKHGDPDSSSEESESSDDSSSDSEDSSSSDASSEDTSGSEGEDDDTSDSDASSDDTDDETKTTKLPQKGAERDTSATLSSAEENAREAAKHVVRIPEEKSTKDKSKSSESDSSDSDSSDSGSSSKGSPSDGSDAETSCSSSDPSSSSDSSDENEANPNEMAPNNRTRPTEDKSSSSSDSSSDSEDESNSEAQQKEDAHVAKRRKTTENGAAVTTAVTTESQQIVRASQEREKPLPKVKERFRRVKVQNLAPELLLNNGYEARGGAANDYGERAHRDLIVTRGAGFRKEKNKKKRGSYRGGEITMENHSIKFDS